MRSLLLVICVATALAAWSPPSRADGYPVPGLDGGVGCGYDIVEEGTRSGADLKVINGRKQVVYNPAAHKGPLIETDPVPDCVFGVKTFRNPYLGTADQYPGTLWVRPRSEMSRKEFFSETKNFDSYSKWKKSSMGLSVTLNFEKAGEKLGDLTASFKRTKESLKAMAHNHSTNFHLTDTFISFYDIGVNIVMEQMLSPPAQFLLQMIDPDHYDPALFDSFISFFGTHYVKQASMGMKVNVTTFFSEDLLNTHGYEWVEKECKISAHIKMVEINFEHNSQENKTQEHEEFKKQSETYENHVGGMADVLAANGYEDWVRTGPWNPAMILERASLVPIHTIILNPKKRELMRQHLIEYCRTGVLAHL